MSWAPASTLGSSPCCSRCPGCRPPTLAAPAVPPWPCHLAPVSLAGLGLLWAESWSLQWGGPGSATPHPSTAQASTASPEKGGHGCRVLTCLLLTRMPALHVHTWSFELRAVVTTPLVVTPHLHPRSDTLPAACGIPRAPLVHQDGARANSPAPAPCAHPALAQPPSSLLPSPCLSLSPPP